MFDIPTRSGLRKWQIYRRSVNIQIICKFTDTLICKNTDIDVNTAADSGLRTDRAEVKIISPKIQLHWDMIRIISIFFLKMLQYCSKLVNVV